MSDVRAEFQSHALTEGATEDCHQVARAFSDLLNVLERLGVDKSREASLVVTNLQTAKMWAVRAIAMKPQNQQAE